MDRWYTTRENVKAALDSYETARNNIQVAAAIKAATGMVEGALNRVFLPEIRTAYFDWPNKQYARSYRLWLEENELISVTSITSAGVALSSGQYILQPRAGGPPYNRVEIDLSTGASFGSGNTYQNSIAIAGLFGYKDETESAGLLAEALDSSETLVDITDGSTIGVGSIIKVDLERMFVRSRRMLDTTQNLATPMTDEDSDTTVAVSNGALFFENEVILLDSEKMLIVEISGNNLIVKRAWDGSVIASHTGSDVYASRTLVVERGVLGTTAAAHNDATAISRQLVPPLVEELTTAEALNILIQRAGGWSRDVGTSATNDRVGRGLPEIREEARKAHGRNLKIAAV